MARPKKKTEFDADKIMKGLLAAVAEVYEETDALNQTANELSMSALKVRKLLITAGAYESEMSDLVNRLYGEGKKPAEICELTGLGYSSVNGYLPYTKMVYNAKELSLNAERINIYRSRRKIIEELRKERNEEKLWDAVVAFRKYPFHTASGLPFTYDLKTGRNGEFNRELLVDRRKDSKTLAWSSVRLAFQNALQRQGERIERPKALGDIRGISYIYPMLYRFGIIDVPEEIAKKMELSGHCRRKEVI